MNSFSFWRQSFYVGLAIAVNLFFVIPSWGQAPSSPTLKTEQAPQETESTPKIDYSRFGGTLTVAIPPVVTLDSQMATDFSSQVVINNLQEGLFSFDENQELVPILASAPPQMEDELHYLLYLRKGIYFHDGSEFDANSVVYTVNRLLDPTTGAPMQPYFAGQIKSAEILDKHTVRIKLAKAYIDVAALFSRIELYPLSPQAVDKYPAGYGKITAAGTGPFIFAEWMRDEKILLKRFDRYWQTEAVSMTEAAPMAEAISMTGTISTAEATPNTETTAIANALSQEETSPEEVQQPHLPYLNILQFRFHANEEMALVDLETRRLSVLGGISAATTKQISSKYIKVLHQPGLLLEQIYFNTKQVPLNNKLVRMALAYGLDKYIIAEEAFGEYATVADSFFPAWHWAHNPDYQGLGYHPQIARQLLKQAGYTQSNPLRFELLCTAEDKFIAQAKMATKQWQELGIQVKLTPLNKEELMTRIYGQGGENRNFGVALEDWQGGINPDLFSYDLYSPDSPYNKVLYKNPLLKFLFYDARSAQRREEKIIFYHQLEKLITADVSTIYLSFPHNIWAYNRYVNGLKQDYRGLISFSRVWFPH